MYHTGNLEHVLNERESLSTYIKTHMPIMDRFEIGV
jgi:hypothetical protein